MQWVAAWTGVLAKTQVQMLQNAGAEGATEGGGEGKDTCKGNLPAGPVEENNSDIGIGRPLLVLYWKPNQAEVGTEEEHHGRGDAEDGGECEGDHAQCRGELRNQVTQFATEVP